MKIKKFIGENTLSLNDNEISLCNDKLHNTKLKYEKTSEVIGRVYFEFINNVYIEGKHKYWGTNNAIKEFKATAKRVLCYVKKQEGFIQKEFNDKGMVKLENSDGTISYSVCLKLFGDLRYKYKKNILTDTEIYSYYDYDTDLDELLIRLKNYYIEKISVLK